MGKGEFYAGFVNSIVAILSLRLVIQVHYNDTLPDLSNVLQNSRGRFYRDQTLKSSRPVSLSLLRWQFILGEWIDKHIRKAILALKNVI